MSTPTLARVPANRKILATFRSISVCPSPYMELAGSRLIVFVVTVEKKAVCPRPGVDPGAQATAPQPAAALQATVRFADSSGPGRYWYTLLTRTSIFGIVYAAVPR